MPIPVIRAEPRTSGDRKTPFAARLLNGDQTPVDLDDCTVAFHMVRFSDNTVQINHAAAVIADAALAVVQYEPSALDVAIDVPADETVRYAAWFVVTKDGKVDHYPLDGKTWCFDFHPAYPIA
jgi:hypothetical protein